MPDQGQDVVVAQATVAKAKTDVLASPVVAPAATLSLGGGAGESMRRGSTLGEEANGGGGASLVELLVALPLGKDVVLVL